MSESRYEIERLIFTYAELMDAGDLAAVAALFADADVSNDKDEVVRGTDRLLERWSKNVRIFPDGTPRTKHVTTNLIIDVVEGNDAATARSYVTVLQEIEGELALQPVFAGGYADRFERVDGKWRFAARKKLAHLIGDLSHHLNLEFQRS